MYADITVQFMKGAADRAFMQINKAEGEKMLRNKIKRQIEDKKLIGLSN